jgi:hypothetical protein
MKNLMKKTSVLLTAALILVLGVSLATYSAVTQVAGLAVAQSGPGQWVNVKDAALGNGLTNGILAAGLYTRNASGTFDIMQGQGDNSANPATGKIPVLPCVATSTSNVLTNTNVASLHCTLNGELTTSPLQLGVLGNATQTSGANAANTLANAAVAGTRFNITYLEAYASAAATCTLTIQDGGATVYSHALTTQTSAAPLQINFGSSGITNTVGNAMQVSISACGGAVTSTINQVASRG